MVIFQRGVYVILDIIFRRVQMITKKEEFLRFDPNVSVGPFVFGTAIEKYFEYGIKKKEVDLLDIQGFNSATYSIPLLWEDVDIVVIDGVIRHILVENFLYYRGNNLIGNSMDETKGILECDQCSKIEHMECTNEYIYYFYSMGIDFWVFDRIVTAATCYLTELDSRDINN